ncbi:hypothetical protein [Actinocorallia aurantiaca]|uniref:Lipoprotein n=1 Tax=Actinocorallia aurantiaca TaxID=46204 RepID=A0ABP6H193_9ACTN
MLRRRMSSRAVKVGMLGTLSMSLAACGGNSYTADCVDGYSHSGGQYKVTRDGDCDSGGNGGRYFWYYGGTATGAGYVYKGTTLKPRKGEIKSKSGRTLQRGGFGSGFSSGG